MKNVFDFIDYRFFQVFSGENRKIHAEIIMVISDFFERDNTPFVDKEELVEYLTKYIENRNFFKILDDEEIDITKKAPREKALSKLNIFKKNGWLIEEKGENYTDIIMFDNNALILLKALEEISSSDTPREYTGYLYVIDNLLKTFDYNQGVSIIEQIYETTSSLMKRLRGLTSSIKKYLSNLLNEDSQDAQKLLSTLLFDYQENIINKAFSNLKLSDNPSKYKNHTLAMLNELRSKVSMEKLINNYKATKNSTMNDEEIESVISKQIQYIYNNIEELQQIIDSIDNKNAKYVKSSTAKLSFILNENYDVIGKVENILKLIKLNMEDSIYEDSFNLHKQSIVDTESLYKPRVYSERIYEMELQVKPEVDKDYVNLVAKRLLAVDTFSLRELNKYVKNHLKNKGSIKASDLEVINNKDLTKIILIQLYSHHEKMCYDITSTNDIILRQNKEFYDFIISKRGKNNER